MDATLPPEGAARVPDAPGGTDDGVAVVDNLVEDEVVYEGIGYAVTDPFGIRGYVDRTTSGGVGWTDGFTNVGAFIPFHLDPNYSLLFLDGRALISDYGQGGVNLNLGYRAFDPTINRITTIAGFWDYDGAHSQPYYQAGVSLESLGQFFDARFNAYLPFSDNSVVLSDTVTGTPTFQGMNIMFNRLRMIETAYKGFDGEVGGPMPVLGRYGFRGYLGAYYLDGNGDRSAGGVKVRVDANITEDWQMSVSVADDRVFGTNVWMNVVLSLPDGRPSQFFRQPTVQQRLAASLQRTYRVQTHIQAKRDTSPAINPVDLMPFIVAHIDPNKPDGGTGSFEDPYGSFVDFTNDPDFDIVLVNPHASGTDTDLNTGIGLLDNQRLLSTGVAHDFTSTRGTFTLPAAVGGVLPVISNSVGGSPVVTLADNNEVSGFVIDGSGTDDGITGTGIVGFNINRNEFRDYRNGLLLTNATGTSAADRLGIVVDNLFTGTPGASVHGVEIDNSAGGTLDLLVRNNDFTDNREDVNRNNVLDAGEDANLNGVLDGAGLVLTAEGGSIINTIIGTPSEDLNLNGVLDAGEDVDGDGILDDIIGNTFSENGDGLVFNTDTGGVINGSLNGNTIDNNARNGVAMNLAGASTIDFGTGAVIDFDTFVATRGIFDNTVTRNDGSGFEISSTGASTLDLTLMRNNVGLPSDLFAGNGGNGFHIAADSGVSTLVFGGPNVNESEDLNRNGVLDPGEDSSTNGVLDPTEDTNNNGILDSEDTNNDGILQFAEDLNNNGILDIEDRNGDGTLQLAEDVNNNGILDPGEDTYFNGILDAPIDVDGDGIIDRSDGNNFIANGDSQISIDFTGTATGTVLAQNNNIRISLPLAGSAIRNGFDSSFVAAGDDTTSGLEALGFSLNYFGTLYSDLFVNNNGNVTFGAALPDYTPLGLLNTATPIIAPFFGDVDTSQGELVTYGLGSVDGHNAFGVNYVDVRHFDATGGANAGLPTNSLQVVLIDRSDIAVGDFDIEFNYANVAWEAGEADGGNAAGLGGTAAVVGFSNGVDTEFQLPGSGVNGAFLDSGPAETSLINNSLNSSILGRYVFEARSGVVSTLPLGNGADAIEINLSDTSSLADVTIIDNFIDGGSGQGIDIFTEDTATIVTAAIDRNQMRGNDQNALRVIAEGLSLVNIDTITQNNMRGNNLSGINLVANGGTITVADISGNDLSRNVLDGIRLETTDGGTIDITSISDNDLDANIEHGIAVLADVGTIGLGTVIDNTFNRTLQGESGIFFDTRDADISGIIQRNIFQGNADAASSTSIGLGGTVNGGLLDLTIGGPNVFEDINGNGVLDAGEDVDGDGVLDISDGNQIISNRDAGIGFNLLGGGTSVIDPDPAIGLVATLDIRNNIITRTTDDATTTLFNGDAINITMGDQDATLTSSVINNNVLGDLNNDALGNAGAGIGLFIDDNSEIEDLEILNNIISRNGSDGIAFHRQGDARLTRTSAFLSDGVTARERAVTIGSDNGDGSQSNLIRRNGGNGISLVAENSRFLSGGIILNDQDFRIENNDVSFNTENGINLLAQADAALYADIINNTINNNTLNGIQSDTDFVPASFDPATVGIDAAGDIMNWYQNTISDNGANGIALIGGTVVEIGDGTLANRNVIERNVLDGIDISGDAIEAYIDGNRIAFNQQHGIDIFMPGNLFDFYGSIDNNVITRNVLDGIEIGASGAAFIGFSFDPVSIADNEISHNGGRGIDILNQVQAQTNLTIDRNTITRNGEEGVYIVNTASGTQTQDVQSRIALARDGSATASTADMNLRFSDNVVTNNGNVNEALNYGGFVLRVGTTAFGSVDLEMEDNDFFGNWGDDLVMESFTSTVNPPTTTTTVFEPDPLARLNVRRFRGNEGGSLSVTRGQEDFVVGTIGVFYENADTFKSPIPTNVPPGPFDSNSRRRNATRLVGGTFGLSVSPAFIGYEGTGRSTFRVESGFEDAGFLAGRTFATDTYFGGTIIVPFDAGDIRNGPDLIGEIDFSWDGSLTPGFVFP
ncbi:MAG: right-handed parallel beta-helix repeat-containing protein [Planctomycetota bacterium]|nr:right-handed parallel beta-helix repeat-containing protein [Planctomycetota bacterium]MDA1213033.1 right-handed parallel beta-helix repeat-containing protein [Planctomycetota bacterium]